MNYTNMIEDLLEASLKRITSEERPFTEKDKGADPPGGPESDQKQPPENSDRKPGPANEQ